METSYRDWERKRRQETEAGRRTAPRRRRREKVSLGSREKRRLTQLIVCIAIFLAVFAGKGIVPDKMEQVRVKLLESIQADTDFQMVFSHFGHAISEGEPITAAFGGLWTDAFGSGAVTVSAGMPVRGSSEFYRAEAAFLAGYPQTQTPVEHWLRNLPEQQEAEPNPVPAAAAAPTPSPAPQPEEPLAEHVEYSGLALPDNATMDKYHLSSIGVEETVTPAMGWVTSSFGWREHPVDGGQKFHNGVDLGVNSGTDVRSFADGTVDYIGDSPIYGKYLQIKHAGGLTSFYAHCSKLCVQQGQSVQAGEKVAESGATGNATGPHLHFELKLNGMLLNPLYYIETS